MRAAVLSIVMITHLFAQNITFTPLPIWSVEQSFKEYTPLTRYLEKELAIKIDFKHIADYTDIIQSFKEGGIDIAVMGPLPFIFLQKVHTQLQPLAVFKNESGKTTYRCALIKFQTDEVSAGDIKVALTQRLSTCGYHNTKILLQKKYGIDLDGVEYEYVGSHAKAAKAVLSAEFTVAGVKEDIAQRFSSVGIETVGVSKPVPEFVLVANSATIPQSLIKAIQKQLLKIPQDVLDGFSISTKNGFDTIDPKLYNELDRYEIK